MANNETYQVCDCGCEVTKKMYDVCFSVFNRRTKTPEIVSFTYCSDDECFYRMAELKLHPDCMEMEEIEVLSAEDYELDEADRRVNDFI